MLIDESRGWPEIGEQACLRLMDGHYPPEESSQKAAYFGVLRTRVIRALEHLGYSEEWLASRELLGAYQGAFEQ